MNTEAPQYAFFKAGRNLSVRCGFKPKPKSKPNPGPGPPASRWSAPGPGKRTRREDHALLIVRDEFRTGYSLIGLLASRARLRFTGIVRISSGQRPANELSSNGECVFPPCLTEGVHPIYRRLSAFIGGHIMLSSLPARAAKPHIGRWATGRASPPGFPARLHSS